MRKRIWDRGGKGALSFTELGFGTAPIGGLYRAVSGEEAQAVMARAWDLGMRYFDTAPLYGFGQSETRLNRALAGRRGFVVSSKVGRLLRATRPGETRDGLGKWFEVPSRREVFDYSHDGVMRSLEASLERSGLDRIDVVYAHDLDIFTHGSGEAMQARLKEFMAGGYRALLSLREQGVIRAFGAGINEWQPAEWLAERGDFDIFLLAGRYTLLEQAALDSFLPLAQARGIGVVIGGPYNSGILASGARPGAHYNYGPAPAAIMARVARLEAICAAHDCRLVEAALQFPLLHPAVLSVIPGAQSLAEVEANAAAAAAPLPEALWQALKDEGLLHPEAPTRPSPTAFGD